MRIYVLTHLKKIYGIIELTQKMKQKIMYYYYNYYHLLDLFKIKLFNLK